MQYDHSICSLANLNNEQVKEACERFIIKYDWNGAYHCAVHHLEIKHGGMAMVGTSSGLFHDRIPGMVHEGEAAGNAITDKIVEKLGFAQKLGPDIPFAARLQIRTGCAELQKNLAQELLLPYLWGSHLSHYVATRGQGCLFSLIDPTLCNGDDH